jgi:DNA polymerase III alpha subunit
MDELKKLIREVPDYPKPGILFYDLTTLLKDKKGFHLLIDRLCDEGLIVRYGPGHAQARERLEVEKRVIREMGFVSYFLIVADFVRFAREHGVPVGPGRDCIDETFEGHGAALRVVPRGRRLTA